MEEEWTGVLSAVGSWLAIMSDHVPTQRRTGWVRIFCEAESLNLYIYPRALRANVNSSKARTAFHDDALHKKRTGFGSHPLREQTREPYLMAATPEHVILNSSKARTASTMMPFTKSGQVLVRTMSSNAYNLPMILGVCQEF